MTSILFTRWLNRQDPDALKAALKQEGGEAQEWPMWTNGLLGRALVAYYAASGDERILRVMNTADSGDRTWLRKGFALSNRWPASETYTWSGQAAIRDALTELFSTCPIQPALPDKALRLYESWYNRMPNAALPWYRHPAHGQSDTCGPANASSWKPLLSLS